MGTNISKSLLSLQLQGSLDYTNLENVTNFQVRTQEGARYGLVVSVDENHQDRSRREAGAAASHGLSSGW